jgi:hypothetical protein
VSPNAAVQDRPTATRVAKRSRPGQTDSDACGQTQDYTAETCAAKRSRPSVLDSKSANSEVYIIACGFKVQHGQNASSETFEPSAKLRDILHHSCELVQKQIVAIENTIAVCNIHSEAMRHTSQWIVQHDVLCRDATSANKKTRR